MNLLLDIRYTLRILLKTPGFTALTIAVMTIGLGVSIFMLSVANAIVFRPLDFKDGERLMFINRLVDNRVQQTILHDYQKIQQNLSTHLNALSLWVSQAFGFSPKEQLQFINQQSNKLLNYAADMFSGAAGS